MRVYGVRHSCQLLQMTIVANVIINHINSILYLVPIVITYQHAIVISIPTVILITQQHNLTHKPI